MPSSRNPDAQRGHIEQAAFVSGDVRGQWSTEIWMREGYAFVTDAEQQVPVHSLRARGVTPLLADPRRLILRVVCDGYRFVLAALHGPHRATEHSAIDAWWSDTLSHLRRVSNGDHLLLGGDLNAALGSITTDQIGDLAAELEDTAGYWVRSLARDQRLCLPATFAAFHKGASHTYVQKKSHCLIRPDFLLVPQTWCVGHTRRACRPRSCCRYCGCFTFLSQRLEGGDPCRSQAVRSSFA